jgi:hypothetical protein
MTDRYITPCPLPTPYERELLTILIEECAEVQKRATKLLRFGRDEIQPGLTRTNAYRLAEEIGDLRTMLTLAEEAGLSPTIALIDLRRKKLAQLARYMQTEPPHPDAEHAPQAQDVL